jgi:hypothetical protein
VKKNQISSCAAGSMHLMITTESTETGESS